MAAQCEITDAWERLSTDSGLPGGSTRGTLARTLDDFCKIAVLSDNYPDRLTTTILAG